MGKGRAGIALATAVAIFAAWGALGSIRPGSRSEPTVGTAPHGLSAFYAAPTPVPDVAPGTLIKSEKVAAPTLHGTLYRVMYASRSLQNDAVVVTGIVIVPKRPAPAGGYPVVTWAHGTTGLGDECAPSISPGAAPPPANDLLDRGWAVAETDYAGAGTPGVMAYLAGATAARNTIDIVRAARNLSAAHASDEYVVWGYSEGGQAAMFALAIGDRYAPELRLRGVVAGAPPSQFADLFSHLTTSKYSYYLLMVVVGLNAQYGAKAAPLDQILTPAGMGLVPTIQQGCVSFPGRGFHQRVRELLQFKLAYASIRRTFKADPFTVPAWRTVIEANDPKSLTTAAKSRLLIVQGGADEQIPAQSSRALATQQCALGQNVERWLYLKESHGGALMASIADVTHWIGERLAGNAGPDRYVPKGRLGVVRTGCPT
jgi:hypothetical protein